MEINTLSLYNLNSADISFEICEETVKIKTPDHEEGFGLVVKNMDVSEAEIIIKSGGV